MKLNWKHLVAGTIITMVAIFLAYYYEQLWFLSIIFIGFIYLMVFALLQVAGDPPPRGGIVQDPTVAMMHDGRHTDQVKPSLGSYMTPDPWFVENILDGLNNIDTDPQHDHSERIKNGLCPWFATWEYVWPGETEPRRVCSSHMEHVKANAILCRINVTTTRIADPTSPNNSLIYCEHDMIERRKQAAKAQKPAHEDN
jgi:hypothetical protein